MLYTKRWPIGESLYKRDSERPLICLRLLEKNTLPPFVFLKFSGNECIKIKNCETGESFEFATRQAITNLTLAKEAFQNPQVLDKTDAVVEESSVQQIREPQIIEENITSNSGLIKGVDGLAAYLGVGKTMAQAIINSKKLMQSGAQYRVGKSWCFDKEKLDGLLLDNPELLKDVHIKRCKK